MKHEGRGREGERERKEGRDSFPRAREVNALMFDDSPTRGDSPSLSDLTLPCWHPHNVIFVFPLGDKLETSFGLFQGGKRKTKKEHV